MLRTCQILLTLIFIFSCKNNNQNYVIEKYGIFEDKLKYKIASNQNPFTDLELKVEFTNPKGKTKLFWGFYDGNNVWKFRFMPGMTGTWNYKAYFEPNKILKEGTFECVESDIPGIIQPYAQNPIWFSLGNEPFLPRSFHIGDRFFSDGENAVTGEIWNDSLRNKFIKWLLDNQYNMLSIASHYLNRNVESRGLGWNTPNLWDSISNIPNPKEYERMENLLDLLAEKKIIVFPFAGFFGKESNFPKNYVDQVYYIKYSMARIAPYWNILYLVGGPEPLYKKNPHLTQHEVNKLGKLIDSLNIFNHLLSIHSPTGDDPFINAPWSNYTIMQGPKTLDRKELYQGIISNHHPTKPLYAQETLWPGNVFGHPIYSLDDIRKNAYTLLFAGAAINFADMDGNSSSGFSGKLDFNLLHQEYHAAIAPAWNYFEKIEFYNLKPAPELAEGGFCLTDYKSTYYIYHPDGDSLKVKIPSGNYIVKEVDPLTHKVINEAQIIIQKDYQIGFRNDTVDILFEFKIMD